MNGWRWMGWCGAAAGMAALSGCLASTPGETAPMPADLPLQRLSLKEGRARPLVVIVADSDGTETTDFIVPYGVLKESGVADVVTVSTRPGPVPLMPALRALADTTVAAFDRAAPGGADVLIVPAMHAPRSAPLLDFVRRQAAGGALLVSVCEGAWVLAHAGLLEGRKATTHWYAMGAAARQYPATRWMSDRRYVADGRVMSTSGVTASVPASLALVEAIGGRAAAEATASRLGVASWGSGHDASRFALSPGRVAVLAGNWLSLWRHETIAIPVLPGVDEIALALQSDAWSRTYRSQAVAVNGTARVVSRRGLTLLTAAVAPPGAHVPASLPGPPVGALDATLGAIAERHGATTADIVAIELEYPRP